VAGVILIGTQGYNWLLNPFAYLFSKYWNEPILYIGDSPPDTLPANVDFLQVPAYAEGIWPWSHFFGNGLISICKHFEGKIITLFLLDHWLNRPVSLTDVGILTKYMDKNRHIIRANLTEQPCWQSANKIDNYSGLDIIYFPAWDIANSFSGGITFCPSLWNTDLLCEIIEPHWTIWECERLGTEKMKTRHDIISVGTMPALLSRVHGLYHDKYKMAYLAGLSVEDGEIVKSFIPEGWVCN